jgi:Mu transposase, C-terminal domain
VRDSFFAGRAVSDVDTLNAQAVEWCASIAADRRCPGQEAKSVAEVFAEEAPHLLPPPDHPYPLIEQVAVKAGKTPYVRFDLNDYSIPHTLVRRWLTVLADPAEVRVADGQHVIARHARGYGKGEQIEDKAHIQALVEQKRAGRRHRAADLLFHAAPASQTLLARAAANGGNLRSIAATLTGLLQRYGAAELQAAIAEALERNVPHPNAVRFALDRRRQERRQPPPIALNLPEHVKAKDAPVRPARLELYDALKGGSDE